MSGYGRVLAAEASRARRTPSQDATALFHSSDSSTTSQTRPLHTEAARGTQKLLGNPKEEESIPLDTDLDGAIQLFVFNI